MDSKQFDRLTSVLTGTRSRRGLVGGVAAIFGLGGLTLLGQDDALARRKKRRRRKNKAPVDPNQCPVASICNTAPNVCGTAATGEDCSCERSTEGTNVCVNSGVGCPTPLRECTSTDGPEATSCRNSAGFHFFCQEAKTNGAGIPCGCGQTTTTGRVCMPECDNRTV